MLTLEGEQFPITGPVRGSDGPGNSFVYIPSLKAVVTGDIVFDHVYFGVPRAKAREEWSKTIDQITALDPAIIVPGHQGPGATRDMRSIQFMKKYMADWDANVCRLEGCGGDEGQGSGSISRPGNGIHAERSHRDLFSRAETVAVRCRQPTPCPDTG